MTVNALGLKGAQAIPEPPLDRNLPYGFRIRLNHGVKVWGDGSVLIGGAPWRISRLATMVQDLVGRLATSGDKGLALNTGPERAAGRVLLDRGFADPVGDDHAPDLEIAVVIPAMDHANNLARLLASIARPNTVVVDDASIDAASLQLVADHAGATLVRHESNLGPAAARNTGLRHTCSPVVAFIDSDCIASPRWPTCLSNHFLDPSVAAVAPRVIPTNDDGSVLERYERTRSSLDMGDRPELVRSGARLGFVPSAALLVRRSALGEDAFDERLRLGEDVDLIWRLTEAGWLVRYDPSTVVQHQTRTRPLAWLRRRYQYGTSAPDLEARHPGRLTPARPSAWNVAVLVLAATGHPVLGVAVVTAAGTMLWRQLRPLSQSPALAARTVGQGLMADAAAIGHLLRREWWPVGTVALAASPRSKPARLAAACMLVPIALEWVKQRPPLDPIRYAFLRLVDDAAYGTGVITSSLRKRELRPLIPHPKVPGLRALLESVQGARRPGAVS